MVSKVLYLRVMMIFITMFVVYVKINAQLNIEMIDTVLKSRTNYVTDSIPDIFRWYYEPFTYTGNRQFYDTLKSVLLEISFPESTFYWLEYMADNRSSKTALFWTDSFMVHFNCRWIARWDRINPWEDSIIYKLEIHDNLKKSLIEPFFMDFEEWNENVTNRSYLYWDGAGGGLNFCSKVTFKSSRIEIMHTVFRDYKKNTPLFYLREQSEDDYKPRLLVNCDWIIDDKTEEAAWFLICYHKGHESKVFDCEGNEINFEQNDEK